MPDPDPPIHHLPDAEFIKELRRLEGTPEEVLKNEELMQLVLPTVRADHTICETYTYTPEAPLSTPISAFGGIQDPHVSQQEMAAWRTHTTGAFVLNIKTITH